MSSISDTFEGVGPQKVRKNIKRPQSAHVTANGGVLAKPRDSNDSRTGQQRHAAANTPLKRSPKAGVACSNRARRRVLGRGRGERAFPLFGDVLAPRVSLGFGYVVSCCSTVELLVSAWVVGGSTGLPRPRPLAGCDVPERAFFNRDPQ